MVHMNNRVGDPCTNIDPDLRQRILLEAQNTKAPSVGLYPRGITEPGKAVWDTVLGTYLGDFKTRYDARKWAYSKYEVLWTYAMLTYYNSVTKQEVTSFTGGTQLVNDEEADADYEAKLAAKFEVMQEHITKQSKIAFKAVKLGDPSASLTNKSTVFWSTKKTAFYEKDYKGGTVYFIISHSVNVDDDELCENWDEKVLPYLKNKGWHGVGEVNENEDYDGNNQLSEKKEHGNVILSLQNDSVYIFNLYYLSIEDAAKLTYGDPMSPILKDMLDVAQYYKENGVLPSFGATNLPKMQFKFS